MFLTTDQYTAASIAFFESRLAAFRGLATLAMQGTEKIVALNMAVGKASAADSIAAAKDLLAAKDPQAFISLATACVQPHAENVVNYCRHLTDIVSATKAEFTKVADARVAEVQTKLSALVAKAASNVPDHSHGTLLMMKSAIDNANSGYGQFTKTVRQGAELVEGQMTCAANQFSQSVEQMNGRAARK